MLDNNHYTSFGKLDPIHIITNLRRGRDLSDFYKLVDAGKVFVRTHTWKRGDHQNTTTIDSVIPATREDITDVCKNDSIHTRNRTEIIHQEFIFNTTPMTMLSFEEGSSKEMRAKLKELKFPMSKKEGLNA